MDSEHVLDQLNNYEGDNVWGDVIHRLDYDEVATNRAYTQRERNPYCNDLAVIGGVVYDHRQDLGQWVAAIPIASVVTAKAGGAELRTNTYGCGCVAEEQILLGHDTARRERLCIEHTEEVEAGL